MGVYLASPDRGDLVVRFTPIKAERVFDHALVAYDWCGRYGVSVFCTPRVPGENDQDLNRRVCGIAKLGRMRESNRWYWVCSEAHTLMNAGFQFYKDGYPDEISEHYSVDIGGRDEDHTRRNAEIFVGAFPQESRTHYAYPD